METHYSAPLNKIGVTHDSIIKMINSFIKSDKEDPVNVYSKLKNVALDTSRPKQYRILAAFASSYLAKFICISYREDYIVRKHGPRTIGNIMKTDQLHAPKGEEICQYIVCSRFGFGYEGSVYSEDQYLTFINELGYGLAHDDIDIEEKITCYYPSSDDSRLAFLVYYTSFKAMGVRNRLQLFKDFCDLLNDDKIGGGDIMNGLDLAVKRGRKMT